MNKKFELLAPVGNKESFYTAINSGADAVYLGIGELNARGNIENFTIETIKEIIDYAHVFDVKVYITLNILFKDEEFENVKAVVKKLLNYGTDAFIVQDIGLYKFLSHHFPNAELHASTQMGIANLEGAKFLEKLGYKRVVLARETPLKEIENISKNTKIEIEYFIHGALCVSFSGNCYISSLLSGCSGNRGKCKQYCRLPYQLSYLQNGSFRRTEGYLLSTRDFCMAENLKRLAECGVVSFKVEGRAKRPAYIAQTINSYRKILDNNFNHTPEQVQNLKKVYNRGSFINGYFDNQSIIYTKAQNHIGVEIGRVLNVKIGKRFNEITIYSTHQLCKGDVIKFFDKEEEKSIITIYDYKTLGENKYVITSTSIVPVNAKVNLIVDKKLENEALSIKRNIPIDCYFEARIGKSAKLKIKCGDIIVENISENVLEKAKTSPLTVEAAITQLSKTGEKFMLNHCECDIENVFITKAQLNLLRRETIEKLEQALIKNYNKKNSIEIKADYEAKPIALGSSELKHKLMYVFDNTEKLEKSYNTKDKFIFKPDIYQVETISKLCENRENIYLYLPVIATDADIIYIKYLLSLCPTLGIVANNYYALGLLPPNKTIIGENLNVFNSYAVKFYSELGYNDIILNIECENADKIENCGINLYQITEFYPEYMTFKHCPIKEHIGGNCSNCQFEKVKDINYKLNKYNFVLKRRKLSTCQFVLKAKERKLVLSKGLSQVIEVK